MDKIERIVLIGFRGSGKTTIGKELSRMLKWEYISTDNLVELQINFSISDFVKKEGWPTFRRLEKEMIRRLEETMGVVIDCGGGVVEDPQNMACLEENSLIVWVDAALQDILARLQNNASRPLLNQADLQQDIEYNYRRREPFYRRYSRLRVNTSRLGLPSACEEIIAYLIDKS